jgi:hypothetical protein
MPPTSTSTSSINMIQKGGFMFSQTNSLDPYSSTNYTMENGMSSGVLQYVFYFIMLVIIILLILVLVHFTIKPIFRLNPGDKGVIGLPGSNDSSLFWKTPDTAITVKDLDTPLASLVENWSFMLDIQLDNPTANTNAPRILFSRGAQLAQTTKPFSKSDTILTINPSFNVCVFLDRITNDLYIAVQTISPQSNTPSIELISVPNIPVGTAIRLGVFVGSRVLEVYVNGNLLSSKAFPNSLRKVTGPLQPAPDTIMNSTARVANLRIWARPVSPAEFRSYGSATSFDVKPIQDSCVA